MKIGLLQSSPKVGSPHENLHQLLKLVELDPTCDLYVTPELALIGYPPKDLLSLPEYLKQESHALDELLLKSKEKHFSILVGHTQPTQNSSKPLWNAATLISDGVKLKTFFKSRNPSYDIFEEERFFESCALPDPLLSFKGFNLAVAICEDSWDAITAFGEKDIRVYPKPTNPLFKAQGMDVIINLSASPFSEGKKDKRIALMSALSSRKNCPVFYCNQMTANDDLLFDGSSFALSSEKQQISLAPAFTSGLLVCEFAPGGLGVSSFFKDESSAKNSSEWTPWMELYQGLILGIKNYVQKTQHKKVLLGLSGGIDSALVATLATHALGAENVTGISLPTSITSQDSKNEAKLLAQNLKINFKEMPIESLLEEFCTQLTLSKNGLTFENLQARIRGVMLMAQSNATGALLLATGNKSELAMGYSTLYGDMCGGLLPIGDLYKTQVYGLAHFINHREKLLGFSAPIPALTLSRAPTAELAQNQRDSDSLPAYEILDIFLANLIENQGVFSEGLQQFFVERGLKIEILMKKFHANEFKRYQAAPILKVHTRSFGSGWHMPLAKGF